MSRTDHHRPWQIRANDRAGVRKNDPAYFSHDDWFHQHYYECGRYCGWTMSHASLSHPPRYFRHMVWFGPERQRERIDLGRLAREYNAHRDLEDGDFPNHQARHQAGWEWS